MSKQSLTKEHIEVLREEIEHVSWLAKNSPNSARRAAAAMRVVTLEEELAQAIKAQGETLPPNKTRKSQAA